MVACMHGLTTLVKISFSTIVSRFTYEVLVGGAFMDAVKQRIWTSSLNQAMVLLNKRLDETGATAITLEVTEDPNMNVRPGMTVVDIKPGELLENFEQFYATVRMLT